MKTKPVFITLCVLFAAFAAGRHFAMPAMTRELPNEKWLHDKVPNKVGDAILERGTEAHPNVTYKMDKTTYEALNPLGISGQIFRDNQGRAFDVVIIAGDRMESFHEQQWCFHAQGWQIPQQKAVAMQTEGYGQVDFWLMRINQPNQEPLYAAYTFMTPRGFRTDFGQGQRDFLLKGLQTLKPNVGYSFRFIAKDPSTSQEDFLQFVKSYMEEMSTRIPGPKA